MTVFLNAVPGAVSAATMLVEVVWRAFAAEYCAAIPRRLVEPVVLARGYSPGSGLGRVSKAAQNDSQVPNHAMKEFVPC